MAGWWMKRHKRQHDEGLTIDKGNSDRMAREFENALRQRGLEAKKAFLAEHPDYEEAGI